MCLYPIAIKKGSKNKPHHGKKQRDLFATHPEYYANVPCGKCAECKRAITARWAFRLKEQLDDPATKPYAFVATLTYAPEHESKITTPLGLLTLRYRHVQNFLKLLRKKTEKRSPGQKIKYFAVGEYGSKRQRPHYHIIIFGAHEHDIENSWTLGQKPYIDVLSDASIFYVLKYLDKDFIIDPEDPTDDRTPEFRRMSKGLGEWFIKNKQVRRKIKKGELWEVPLGKGRIPTPRYYLEKVLGPDHWTMEKRYVEQQAKYDEKWLQDLKQDYNIHKGVDHIKGSSTDLRRRNRAKALTTRQQKEGGKYRDVE